MFAMNIHPRLVLIPALLTFCAAPACRAQAPDPERDFIRKRVRLYLAETRRDPAALVPLLADPDPKLRARAARAAGRIGAPDAAERLAPLFEDPDQTVRAAAAWGALYLGEGARPLLPLLRARMKGEGGDKIPAFEAVIALGDADSAADLIGLLERHPGLRAQGAGHLFRVDTPAMREWLKQRAALADDPGANGALYSLLRLKLEDENFYRAIAEKSTGERRALALRGIGIGKAPAPESFALFEAAARDAADPAARTEALGLLVKYRGPLDESALSELAGARTARDSQRILRFYDALGDAHCAQTPTLAQIASELATPADSERAETALLPRSAPQSVVRRLVARAAACATPEEFARDAGPLDEALRRLRPGEIRARTALADAIAARPELPAALLERQAADRDSRVRAAAGAALITRGGDPAPWLNDPDLAIVEAAAGTAPDLLRENKAPRITAKALEKAWRRIAKNPAASSARIYLGRAAAACAARDAGCLALLKSIIAKDGDRTVRLDAWGRWPQEKIEARPAWPAARAWDATAEPDAERALASLLPGAPRFEVATSRGVFVMRFEARGDSPAAVLNFRALAAKKYFDGILWHRVVPNFVVQGGDPRGDGSGGPGWTIPCEYNSFPYEAGTVGMALDGKDTGGSQFFIALTRVPHLDFHYTVMGRVDAGMDVVRLLGEDDTILSIRELPPATP